MPPLPLIDNESEIKKVGKVFRAIDHPLRKKILKLLEEKQPVKVTDIYVNLRIEQSVASQHLKILRESKIVETEKRGKSILYKPNYNNLTKLEKIVSEIVAEIVSH
jgi:ArsR family transcriptional regulator, virulence genes transcriptional regulator